MKSFTTLCIVAPLFASIGLADYIGQNQVAKCKGQESKRTYSRVDANAAATSALNIMNGRGSSFSLSRSFGMGKNYPVVYIGEFPGYDEPFMKFPIVKGGSYPQKSSYSDFVILDANYKIASVMDKHARACALENTINHPEVYSDYPRVTEWNSQDQYYGSGSSW